MKIYRLKKIQKIPTSLSKAWDFLSNPKNLKIITPPYMGFKILDDIEDEMYPGQIIKYTVTPLLGIPITWLTEITHVEYQKYFVDEQRMGPYSFWHHKHFIKEIENGVEMTDIIDYKIPLSILGQIAHPILVKKKLNQIFNFRAQKLIELFGAY